MANLDLAELAYAEWLAGEERTRQQNILLARGYYEGDQDVPLTDRQRQYLGFESGGKFCLNYCADVVDSVVERLLVDGMECPDETLQQWLAETWARNRMATKQRMVHAGAVLDAEHFVIVDWATTTNLGNNESGGSGGVRFLPHPRYTDPTVEGTGFGCRAHYPDDDPSQPMRYASKRWTETEADAGGQRRTRQRMTVYYPDRIEKYVMGPGGQWIEFAEPGQAWPTPWVDGARQPLGIPVFHFYNPGVRSELWNAVFIQDAINKSALDLLAASDTEGFRILFAHGWYPTSDGQPPKDDESNLLHVAPGQIIGSTDKDAGLTPIEGGDLSKLEAVLNGWILRLDQVTGTPTSRHQMTAQVASEATLKQQESKLIAKVEERQSLFGGAWTDCLAMARRLENLWGRKGLNEESLISIRWKPAATRDETAELGRLVLKREKLSVPLRQIWMEAGYDQKTIETMMQEPEIRNLTFATYPGAA